MSALYLLYYQPVAVVSHAKYAASLWQGDWGSKAMSVETVSLSVTSIVTLKLTLIVQIQLFRALNCKY